MAKFGWLSGCLLWCVACSDVSTSTPAQDAVATAKSTAHLSDGRTQDLFVFDEFETQARVDLLFIDDNSDSMRDEQVKLGTRFPNLLASLAKIDWQIGITTTDVSDGPYGLRGQLIPFEGVHQNYLTRAMPNAPQLFASHIARAESYDCAGECPSTDEQPLRATIEAIQKRDDGNAGFFRDDADLAVIILSDEDEKSEGGPEATTGADVVAAVKAAFGDHKSLTGFGIIVVPGDTACMAKETLLGGHYGNTIDAFARLTAGATGSICAADFGATLADIGKRVREGVKVAVLTATPRADTLQVQVQPPDPTLTWTLDGRTLTFAHPPAPGSTVVVTYQVP